MYIFFLFSCSRRLIIAAGLRACPLLAAGRSLDPASRGKRKPFHILRKVFFLNLKRKKKKKKEKEKEGRRRRDDDNNHVRAQYS